MEDLVDVLKQEDPEGDAPSGESPELDPESSGEGADKSADPVNELESLKAELAEKSASLDKLTRDYASLHGQIKPQLERDAATQDEISAIHSKLSVMAKVMVSGESEDLTTQNEQITSDLNQPRQTRILQRYYDEASAEVKEAILDEDGKTLIDLEGTGPEIESVKSLWGAGQSGKLNGRDLSVDERINKLGQAVGEIHKLARAEERKRIRAQNEKTKSEKTAARKAARDDSGELDLDTGADGAGGQVEDEDLSPQERIAAGFKRHKELGTKSKIFR